VNSDYPNKAISFKNIWLKQSLSAAWVAQVEYTSKIMYNHLTASNRLVENVTEWAKREACWDQARNISTQLIKDFINELIDCNIEAEEIKESEKEQKLNNKINTMVEVVNFGVDNWKFLIEWGTEHKLLSPIDLEFLKLAVAMENGKFPTEKQCLRIMDILQKVRLESFPK
jgi:predicted RNA-binding protein with EMAP domain